MCSCPCHSAGNVILEGPVHPVMEGNEMSLRCTSKLLWSTCKHNVNFYKDGRLIHKSTTGNMTVRNVSKSDEGLYKCVCGSQESPQSWLIVRGEITSSSSYSLKLKRVNHERLTGSRQHIVCTSDFLISVKP